MTPFKENITKSIDNLNKLQEDVDNTITDLQDQVVDLEEQVEEMENLQTKNVTITENGTTEITADSGYYALEKVNVTTNIQSGNGVLDAEKYNYVASFGSPSRFPTLLKSIDFDCTDITTFENCFKDCIGATSINLTNVNTSNNINFSTAFYDCKSLINLNIENISDIRFTSLTNCFNGCESLVNLNELNLYYLNGDTLSNTFKNCTSLSNNSLQNILKSLLTLRTYTSYNKKLSHIGLSSEQATTCTGFDEWTTLSANGWTTGY